MGQKPEMTLLGQKFFTRALILAAFLAIFGGCNGRMPALPHHEKVDVIVLNLQGALPLNFSPDQYRSFFFGTNLGTSLAISPGGRPVFGSVKDWFLQQSNNKLVLEGDVLGIFSVGKPWQEIWDENRSYLESTTAIANGTGRIIRGAWWVSTLTQIARNALRTAGKGIADEDRLVIICNGAEFNGLTWGSNVIVTGSNVGTEGDDLPTLGIYTHELGHLLLQQPDRYGINYGALSGWDNMADSYPNFPAGYSSHGRVLAGWGNWATVFRGETTPEFVRSVAPLGTLELFWRWRSRIDDVAGAKSFFAWDHRRSVGTEARSELPAQGLLLHETNTNGLLKMLHVPNPEQQEDFLEGHYSKIPFSDGLFVRYHRRLLDQVQGVLDFRSADPAASYAITRNDVAGFNCANGKSLNFLGECLWDFKNVELLSAPANAPQNTLMRFTSTWKPTKITQSRTIIAAGGPPKRVYFTLRPQGSVRIIINPAPRQSSPLLLTTLANDSNVTRTFAVDLDRLNSYGGRIDVTGLESGYLVDRTLAYQQPDLHIEDNFSGPGTKWATYREKLAVDETKELSVAGPDFTLSDNTQGFIRVLFETQAVSHEQVPVVDSRDDENNAGSDDDVSLPAHNQEVQFLNGSGAGVIPERTSCRLNTVFPLNPGNTSVDLPIPTPVVPAEFLLFSYCDPTCGAEMYVKIPQVSGEDRNHDVMGVEIPVYFGPSRAFVRVRRSGGNQGQNIVIRSVDSVIFPREP